MYVVAFSYQSGMRVDKLDCAKGIHTVVSLTYKYSPTGSGYYEQLSQIDNHEHSSKIQRQ